MKIDANPIARKVAIQPQEIQQRGRNNNNNKIDGVRVDIIDYPMVMAADDWAEQQRNQNKKKLERTNRRRPRKRIGFWIFAFSFSFFDSFFLCVCVCVSSAAVVPSGFSIFVFVLWKGEWAAAQCVGISWGNSKRDGRLWNGKTTVTWLLPAALTRSILVFFPVSQSFA